MMSVNFVKRIVVAAMALGALAGLSTSSLAAQTVLCGKHSAFVEALKTKFNESRQAIGISGTNSVIEFYLSEAGTWTMLVTSANGVTCIMAAGHSWDGKTTLAAGTAI
jgi:hypothetical protein